MESLKIWTEAGQYMALQNEEKKIENFSSGHVKEEISKKTAKNYFFGIFWYFFLRKSTLSF